MRRVAVTVALATLLVLAGCSSVFSGGVGPTDTPTGVDPTPRPDAPGLPDSDVRATVTRVVDGDTLKVEFANGTEDTVRLVGVDTPEIHSENTPAEFEGVPDTEAGRNCLRRWGDNADEYLKERLEGAEVGLAFDENLDRRGYYGRLLTYVVYEESNVNYDLVAEGYARVYDSEFTRKQAFLDAEAAAMDVNRGLWECATESPPASPTTTASASGLAVTVHADAEGNDNENLNDEYVTLVNRGDAPLDLSGWTVADEAGHSYEFGDVTLAPGEQVRLHTGSGEDSATDVYWGRSGAVWNNGGDTVTIRDSGGELVVERSY